MATTLWKSLCALSAAAGVTCPTLDPIELQQAVLATDLILGRDRFAQRFLKDYREHQSLS